jgi:hypothetical protein
LATDVKLYYDRVDLLTQLGLIQDTAAGVPPCDGYCSGQLFLEAFGDHALDNLTFKIAQ